ncbi:hypothetical protein [Desulfosarcina ovata]|nr:hypothetical protein [Desulfosarcina ovata]
MSRLDVKKKVSQRIAPLRVVAAWPLDCHLFFQRVKQVGATDAMGGGGGALTLNRVTIDLVDFFLGFEVAVQFDIENLKLFLPPARQTETHPQF